MAPPFGVVSIISPPAPPSVVDVTIPQFATSDQRADGGTSAQDGRGSQHIDAEAGVTQPSLFGTLEPATQVVRKLRLPSTAQSEPLFMDETDSYKTNTMIVNTEESLRVLVKSLRDACSFALDTESTSDDPWHHELGCISVSLAAGEAYYIPVGHIQTVDGHEAGVQ